MQSELFISIIIGLSVLFLLLSITMVGVMLIRRYLKIKFKNRHSKLTVKYQEYLAEFISLPNMGAEQIAGSTNANTIKLSKKDIIKSYRRKILSKEIYLFHKQLDGRHAELIKQLYLGLSFFEDTQAKLKSNNWIHIATGIDEARQFNLFELKPLIRKQINHRNPDVRCQAIIAVISMEKGKLDILQDISHDLKNWEKHKILFTLQSLNIQLVHIPEDSDTKHADLIRELNKYLSPNKKGFDKSNKIHQLC